MDKQIAKCFLNSYNNDIIVTRAGVPWSGWAIDLETDSSGMAVGTVLAKELENGHVLPDQYANRTLTAAERSYSTCEMEALATMFSTKTFWLYLLLATRWVSWPTIKH